MEYAGASRKADVRLVDESQEKANDKDNGRVKDDYPDPVHMLFLHMIKIGRS
jgi:hypothetical protein